MAMAWVPGALVRITSLATKAGLPRTSGSNPAPTKWHQRNFLAASKTAGVMAPNNTSASGISRT